MARTTSRLINVMEIGEIAKSVDRIKDEYVTRTDSGFYWCDEYGRIMDMVHDRFWINEVVLNLEWVFTKQI